MFKVGGASTDIEFDAQVDCDGDLVLTANRVPILYIESLTGLLMRFFVGDDDIAKLPTLTFKENVIVLSE